MTAISAVASSGTGFGLTFEGRGSWYLIINRGDGSSASFKPGRVILGPREEASRGSLLTSCLFWACFSTSIVLRPELPAFHDPRQWLSPWAMSSPSEPANCRGVTGDAR